jgi:[acyl-carrier-protein] S-malonyltransferase
MLPVSAPFHCALMAPAADVMDKALSDVSFGVPTVPVVPNVRAQACSDPTELRALLVEQITGAVRWRESVAWMAGQGVTEIWEIGAGKALSGMVRRIDRSVATRALGMPTDVKAVLEA